MFVRPDMSLHCVCVCVCVDCVWICVNFVFVWLALLCGVLDTPYLGEDSGGHHWGGPRFRRALCGSTANLLLLSLTRYGPHHSTPTQSSSTHA